MLRTLSNPPLDAGRTIGDICDAWRQQRCATAVQTCPEMFPVWLALREPLLTGCTRGTAFQPMDTSEPEKYPHAAWAATGRRWADIPKEERLALHPSLALPIRAEMQAYQEARERKNRRKEAARIGRDEAEAWAEYEAREKAERLARAIRKLRARK